MTDHQAFQTETGKSISETIELSQETLAVSKERVSIGKVRVRTVVDTVEDIARADLEHQDVEVTRVVLDRVVATRPDVRTEGQVTIIPIVEEVLFVEKRLVLKEELHIRRRITTETVETPITLRRQRAVVDYIQPDRSTKTEGTEDEHD